MILGQFSPYIFFRYLPIFVGSAIILMYWISQYYQHQPPFPHCWISGVAQHFPQYVYFRIATISGSVLMAMGWFTNHFYIKTICRQHVFNIKKYHSEVILIFGLMGSFALMGSTAYIDTGKMDGPDHRHCAMIFFVSTVVAQSLNTILFLRLANENIVNKKLAWVKFGQFVLSWVQVYISYAYTSQGVSMFGQTNSSLGNDLDKFIQWSMTYTVLAGFFIMSYDLQKFQFVYSSLKQSQANLAQAELN